jgi:hypothetical protein
MTQHVDKPPSDPPPSPIKLIVEHKITVGIWTAVVASALLLAVYLLNQASICSIKTGSGDFTFTCAVQSSEVASK